MPPKTSNSTYTPLNDYMNWASKGLLPGNFHIGLLYNISQNLPAERKAELVPYYKQLGEQRNLDLPPATQREIAYRYKDMVPAVSYGVSSAHTNSFARSVNKSKKRKAEVIDLLSDSSSDESEDKSPPNSWEDYVKRQVKNGHDPKSFIPQKGETSNTYRYSNMTVTVVSSGDCDEPARKKSANQESKQSSAHRQEESSSVTQSNQSDYNKYRLDSTGFYR